MLLNPLVLAYSGVKVSLGISRCNLVLRYIEFDRSSLAERCRLREELYLCQRTAFFKFGRREQIQICCEVDYSSKVLKAVSYDCTSIELLMFTEGWVCRL